MGRLYVLIGEGVSSTSLSPVIHNTLYRLLGVKARYIVWEPSRLGGLRAAVERLRREAAGFNVTIPYKEEVTGLLDGLGGEARSIGAVNTVANINGRLIGYNTDYRGIVECLRGERHHRALLLGAGGAARAAVYALKAVGVKELIVANRSTGRAQRLAAYARSLGLEARTVSLAAAPQHAGEATLIVNATPLGSASCCPQATPLPPEALGPQHTVFDMAYNPPETVLLREARRRGARIIDGLCMLVWQALHAEHLWLGITPSNTLYQALREKALEALRDGTVADGGL